MRGILIVGAMIGGGLLGAFAPPATSFDIWKTGDGILSYHRLSGDCETLNHRFGRNAVWGRWEMPASAVEVGVAPDGAGARMTFTCRDGSDCIKAGAYLTMPDRLATHTVPFGSIERARFLEKAITDTRRACDASAG
jgi:hypothetical protein